MTTKYDETEDEIIVDTGSPVTILPPDKEIKKDKKILQITKYQDESKKEVKLLKKATVEAKQKGIKNNLNIIITEREGKDLLLGTDGTIQNIESTTNATDQSQKHKIVTKFEKLLKTNRAKKDTGNKIPQKAAQWPIKEETRALPCYPLSYIERDVNKLIKFGYLEKTQKVKGHCLVYRR